MRQPDGVSEGEDRVGDELQLRLELGVIGGEALGAGAEARVARIVWCARAASVPASELVLPELCDQTCNRTDSI